MGISRRRRLSIVLAVGAACLASTAPAAASRPAIAALAAISCPTVTSCVAVGGDAVVRTTDGGAHWDRVASPPDVFQLSGVACRSATRCLVVGSDNRDSGAVFATVDGGATWQVQEPELPGGFFLAISCASPAMCVITGNSGVIFTTADGGRTWAGQTLTTASLINAVDCPTVTVCEAVGYSGGGGVLGVSLRSTDGGQTWQRQLLPETVPFPTAISCLTITNCVTVGEDTIRAGSVQVGVIAGTVDGGTTWRGQHVPHGFYYLAGVACPDIGLCTAVGGGPHAVVRTVDGGRTWTPQGPRSPFLTAIDCPARSTCVAVGQTSTDRGAIYRTTDAGGRWEREPIS